MERHHRDRRKGDSRNRSNSGTSAMGRSEDRQEVQREKMRKTMKELRARKRRQVQDAHRNHSRYLKTRSGVTYNQTARNDRTVHHTKKWNHCVKNFETNVRLRCSHVCNCCGRLWYKRSIRRIDRRSLEEKGGTEAFLNYVFTMIKNGLQEFCRSCAKHLQNLQIPQLCLNNGLHFPEIDPAIKCLNRIEERLVSPSHVFQSIWSVMGPHGQLKAKGGIVNVPVNLDTTVSSLPRPVNDSHMIHVRLARSLKYTSNYLSGIATIVKIYDAARILVHKPLFAKLGITLSDNWTLEEDEQLDSDEDDEMDLLNSDLEIQETLLAPEEGIRLAPAEGYRPNSILLNPDSEFLAFPKIFGGYGLNPYFNGKPIPYSEVTKSMAMRYDRRVASRGDYLLFMAKKLELIKLNNNIGICLRKKTRKRGESITAGDMVNSSYVEGLVQHDDGFRVLHGIRSSASHLKTEKSKVTAGIRQFGLPTIFVTLSAADTKWPELLVQLKKTLDGVKITEAEAESLSYNERASLVQRDPITCSLHFEERLKEIKKTWKCEDGPFLDHSIPHLYHRIEFQQRGSPHAHILLWLDGAPTYDGSYKSKQDVCEFVDKIITCSSNRVDEKLIELQTHKHTKTCKKKNGQTGCRFGIPFLPMRKTVILEPLEDTSDESEMKNLKRNFTRIQEMQSDPEVANWDFETFLERLNFSEDEYLLSIRSSLKKHKLFLKRSPNEMFINPYSIKILTLMRSNMDIQFVLDAFACASYILNYINKSDRGLSMLIEKAAKELRRGNPTIRDCLKSISNTHYNNSELSVQEACYNILQLNLTQNSEDCIFIPTSPPGERVKLVKSKQDLQEMDPDSDDIFVPGLLDHYVARPPSMENITLAEFAANYTFTKRFSMNAIALIDSQKRSAGYVVKRKKPRIIRYRGYTYACDPDNYFREMLMLYYPWRNEKEELLDIDGDTSFLRHQVDILRVRKHFHALEDDVMETAFKEANNVIENDDRDAAETSRFDFDNYHLKESDNFCEVLQDQVNTVTSPESFISPGLLQEEDYVSLLAKLNPDQRDYVNHVGNHFKTTNDEPFYHFLTGGAGVGKSLVISALFQVLSRIFNSNPESNPDQPAILLCAPTGKAAYNIRGKTLHSQFRLPINQNRLNVLSADISNTMAKDFANVKLIIIDECSMVGQTIFAMVDKRLRDLFDEHKIFGGISMICCGDFCQLWPVFSRPLYCPLSSNPYEELFGNNIWHNFEVFRLKKIMRQDDSDFQRALNNMAVGKMTLEDVELIKSREFIQPPTTSDFRKAIHLFARNEDVDNWNLRMLLSIPGPATICRASDVITGQGSAAAMRQITYSAQKAKPKDTMGIPIEVSLKIGALYMMTYNVDISDGLSNGVCGKLQSIDYGTNSDGDKKPLRLWIEFEDDSIGTNCRKKHSLLMKKRKIPITWTPIEPIVVKIRTRKDSNLTVNRKQYPLCLAHAITIHKSQGMSLPHVAVHLKGAMSRALLYVACSRATTLLGLYIIGDFTPPRPLAANDYLLLEFQRWKQMRMIPSFRFLRNDYHGIQAVYHNVQSLRKHWKILRNDLSILKSHIVCLGETWTTLNDDLPLKGFKICQRIDNHSSRRARGVWLYTHKTLDAHIQTSGSHVITFKKRRIEICWVKIGCMLYIGLYASPRCGTELFQQFFAFVKQLADRRDRNVIIMGDFNVDNSSLSRFFSYLLKRSRLHLANQSIPTTRSGSCLDWVLSNCELQCGNYISFTSYHDPIYVRANPTLFW